ncbi:glycosyltransferase [Maridesulfovibrio zosterae]|uniref:glycosyltransferase n=1 Tax=Maridesulfovibrio zosterae TaxID=82171 RepID=UPI000401FBF6|nr:glycosyltransferase [Maridesulfovibrio zosterae]
MENSKKVSIVTPVFNAEKYLEQCIESVLAQTYPNVEHVFADGGSTDSTLEILAKYKEMYPDRIQYSSESDNGVGDALKRAYRQCTGDVIGWIDADDRYEPDAVENAMAYFSQNADAYFLYGKCDLINADNEIIGCFVIKDYDKREWLNVWHYIVFCATFFRREVIEEVGFVNDLGNDLCFYLRVGKKFKMHRIDKKLTNWRLHQDSISLKQADREASIRKDRAKEDFMLVIRHRGSLFSPRALTYLAVLEPVLVKKLKPFLGFAYPLLGRIGYRIKASIAVVNREGNGFAYPVIKSIAKDTKNFIVEKFQQQR